MLRGLGSWVWYLLIVAVGIPWYWPRDDDTVWLGAPAWAVVAVLASASASALTAWRLRRPWPGEDEA